MTFKIPPSQDPSNFSVKQMGGKTTEPAGKAITQEEDINHMESVINEIQNRMFNEDIIQVTRRKRNALQKPPALKPETQKVFYNEILQKENLSNVKKSLVNIKNLRAAANPASLAKELSSSFKAILLKPKSSQQIETKSKQTSDFFENLTFDPETFSSPEDAITKLEEMENRIAEYFNQDPVKVNPLLEKMAELKSLYITIKPLKSGNKNLFPLSMKILQTRSQLEKLIEIFKIDELAQSHMSREVPQYTRIGLGKAKIVDAKSGDSKFVYITAVNILKEAEIKQEVKTAQTIQENLYRINLKTHLKRELGEITAENVANSLIDIFPKVNFLNVSLSKPNDMKKLLINRGFNEEYGNKIVKSLSTPQAQADLNKELNLALDLEELKGADRKEGKYTLKALKAVGDLEKVFEKAPPRNFREKALFGLQMLNGMRLLHLGGYLHGDLKIDNLNIYETLDENGNPKRELRISDFGKTQTIPEKNIDTMYTGNPRYASVEGRLSQKSEVYSAALVLIRISEEGLLDPESGMITNDILKNPEDIHSTIKPNEKRKGIEKALIMNKYCPQTESSLGGKVTVIARMFSPKNEHPRAEIEVHGYINALIGVMEKSNIGSK